MAPDFDIKEEMVARRPQTAKTVQTVPAAAAAPLIPAPKPAPAVTPTPQPLPQPVRKVRNTFMIDTVRRRRLNDYERSLRREAHELEDESQFDTENEDLVRHQIRGRRKKAALPGRERAEKRLGLAGKARTLFGLHDKARERLMKYRSEVVSILRMMARSFSSKRGGNKQA